MFVAFDPASAPWKQINCTIGVSKLVSFGAQLNPVPLNFISGLMLRCDADGKLLPSKELKKGDSVQLFAGPFTDYIAKVETIDSNQRIWVLMELMGRITRISVDSHQLQIIK